MEAVAALQQQQQQQAETLSTAAGAAVYIPPHIKIQTVDIAPVCKVGSRVDDAQAIVSLVSNNALLLSSIGEGGETD